MADEYRELRTLRTIDLTADTWPVVAALECGHFKTFGYEDSPTLLTVVECAECRPKHAIVSSELPSHAVQFDGAGRGACGTWEGASVGAGVPRRVVRAVSVAALVRIVDESMAQGSARLLVAAADRLAAAVAHRIEVGHLDARSEAGDALLDYDTLDEHRAALGIEPREGRIVGGV